MVNPGTWEGDPFSRLASLLVSPSVDHAYFI